MLRETPEGGDIPYPPMCLAESRDIMCGDVESTREALDAEENGSWWAFVIMSFLRTFKKVYSSLNAPLRYYAAIQELGTSFV